MVFDFQTHIPVKGGEEHQMRLNPYVRIGGAEGSFLLRDGKFWTDDGIEVDEEDVPQWVLDEVDRMKPAGLEAVGFKAQSKAAPAKPAASVPAKVPVK